MHYYFTALSVVAGICLGFGILYLFIGLHRKVNKRLNLIFSLFALSYAGTLLGGVRWYSATTVSEFMSVNRWDALFAVTAFISLVWYVAFYTRVRPRILLGALTLAFILPGMAHIARPNMIYGEILGLTYVVLPWGEELAVLEATDSAWSLLFMLAELATLGFILLACFRQYRRGERQAATILGAGMLWFIVLLGYEILGEMGVAPYIPLGEIGFLGIAIAVSLQMANSVIRTEEALERHQQNLAGLVEARTAELRQSNESLAQEIDERKQIQEVLRVSERRYRSIIENSYDGIVLVDEQGLITEWNRGMERISGLGRAEVLGQALWDVQFRLELEAHRTPELYEQLKAGTVALLEAEQAPWLNQVMEREMQRADGTPRVLQHIPSTVQTEKDLMVLSIVRDITELRRAEEATSYEQGLLKTLLDNTTDYVYFKDRDRRFVRVSNAFCDLFKCGREEIIGKRDEELFPPEVAEETVNDDRHVIETGTPLINKEEGGDSIGGEAHWVLTTKLPWYDQDGNIIGLFGISKEITERWRAEQALRESEEKFRNLAEQSPNMIFINKEGRVVYTNQKCTEILGYTRGEFHAEDFDFLALIAPEYIDLVKENFRRHLHGENVPAYEYALITKGGERIEAINSTALISYEGERAILGTVTDITERVRAEQVLGQRAEELAILHQTAQILTSVTDLSAALEQVAEMIAYLFNARSTRITVPTDGEKELKILVGFVREPVPDEAMTISAYPLTEMPNTRDVLNTGELRVIYDVQALSLASPLSEAVTELNLQSIMLVPLMVRGTPRGILSISTDQVGREFTQDEVQLAETIAGDIAAAIENARLFEQAKAAAAAEERNRIARELHDSVTQTMYSVSIVAEALPRMLERNLAEAKRNAAYLRQTTLGALAEMRTLLFELRPDTLAKARLNVLLQQLADVLTGRTRVPVEVTINGDLELPVNVKIALYRIAQEAFNNISKHAQATQVWVRLHGQPDEVLLTIRDNGRGFDLDSIPVERLGLQIMQERADQIGASFKVESEPGQGTQVSVRWLMSVSEVVI